jgi:hypothetical protein
MRMRWCYPATPIILTSSFRDESWDSEDVARRVTQGAEMEGWSKSTLPLRRTVRPNNDDKWLLYRDVTCSDRFPAHDSRPVQRPWTYFSLRIHPICFRRPPQRACHRLPLLTSGSTLFMCKSVGGEIVGSLECFNYYNSLINLPLRVVFITSVFTYGIHT